VDRELNEQAITFLTGECGSITQGKFGDVASLGNTNVGVFYRRPSLMVFLLFVGAVPIQLLLDSKHRGFYIILLLNPPQQSPFLPSNQGGEGRLESFIVVINRLAFRHFDHAKFILNPSA
jgi:hypothetical protein